MDAVCVGALNCFEGVRLPIILDLVAQNLLFLTRKTVQDRGNRNKILTI